MRCYGVYPQIAGFIHEPNFVAYVQTKPCTDFCETPSSDLPAAGAVDIFGAGVGAGHRASSWFSGFLQTSNSLVFKCF